MTGYDAIVVGARVAGSATALLLARQGRRVLLLDRAAFPSDTVSSHQVQVPGVARLRRWGLLDRIRERGTPPTRDVRIDLDGVVMTGRFPAFDGVDALYSPRRQLLDTLLLEAAREAGAEVRENFRVEELLWERGRVIGIRGRERVGRAVTEHARLVIGADGKRSTVAKVAGARSYRERPPLAFASYTYWAGLQIGPGEYYQRPGRVVAVFPTNDDLVMVYTAQPIGEFDHFRTDPDGHYLKTLDLCGDLGDRARNAERAERLRTTPDQPNRLRVSHGPGWALVGDAGAVMDSITAQGITNALRDAELLATAIGQDQDLERHRRSRDAAIGPIYDFTVRTAEFRPTRRAERIFFERVAARQAETDRFLGAFAGITSPTAYFRPARALRTLGLQGIAQLAGTRKPPPPDHL